MPYPMAAAHTDRAARVLVAKASWRAGQTLRGQILELAAVLLQTDAGSLDIRDSVVVDADGGDERITLEELGNIAFLRSFELPDDYHPVLVATERFRVRELHIRNAAHAAYVEVDPDTGFVKVLNYWVVEDCGQVINPQLVAEQQRGSVVHGLGDALYELPAFTIRPDSFKLQQWRIILYRCGNLQISSSNTLALQSSKTTLGAKGAEESGMAGVPQSILSAVNDAIRPFGRRSQRYP